jgi:biopolymer transport protein ExbB/TolQ
LYLISDALLIPVIIFLLLLFVRSLMLIGGGYSMFIQRSRQQKSLNGLLAQMRTSAPTIDGLTSHTGHRTVFSRYLRQIIATPDLRVHAEKALSDLELEGEKELEKCKILIRTGPMLGLMGTLIPMGPALTGLAAGNLDVMAQNMRLAFSTTVVGIFIGGIGFLIHLVKRRWFLEDVKNCSYIVDVLFDKELRK